MKVSQLSQQIPQLESQVIRLSRNYLEKEGFLEMMTPRLVRASGSCENINTLFEVSVDRDHSWFSDQQVYLSQTSQLYLEAYVPIIGKVFAVGPSFRAEPKVDNRHLCEFQLLEIELPGGLEKLLYYIEGLIKTVAFNISINEESAKNIFGLKEEKIDELKNLPPKFPRLTYDEAIKSLQELGQEISWGDDIKSYHEQLLVQNSGNYPLFITHYPDPMWHHGKEIEVEKFFNMLPDGKGRILCSDLILPEAGEAVGASARAHELPVLKERLINSRMFKMLQSRGGGLEDFEWYFHQVEENGAVPHAGCGFGLSRIIKWIRGSDDIKKVVTFPTNRASII